MSMSFYYSLYCYGTFCYSFYLRTQTSPWKTCINCFDTYAKFLYGIGRCCLAAFLPRVFTAALLWCVFRFACLYKVGISSLTSGMACENSSRLSFLASRMFWPLSVNCVELAFFPCVFNSNILWIALFQYRMHSFLSITNYLCCRYYILLED
jgi:hypothetical protein